MSGRRSAMPLVRAGDAWLRAPWPGSVVGTVMTTRVGGVSRGPYAEMNLGDAVGDDPQAVACNRERLEEALDGAAPVYLRQVHGARVVRIGPNDVHGPIAVADASVTASPGVACIVQVADCLPVLVAAANGRAVAAAHAGWRGLAAGVIEATVAATCAAADCGPADLEVWLGACIGPRRFEVGADVVDAFIASGQSTSATACFTPLAGDRPDAASGPRPRKWLADLPGLARVRLAGVGVRRISGGGWCTVEDASRFFSFRRDGVSGRMAAAIWIRSR